MTQPFRFVWTERALEDWRRLPTDQATAVARAVERFPHEGIVIALGPTEYLLLIGDYGVVLLVGGDAVHVDRVRNA